MKIDIEKLTEQILEITNSSGNGWIDLDSSDADRIRLLLELALPLNMRKRIEQLCDNPNCEDGVADWDMYGHPIYCQVCDNEISKRINDYGR